MLEVGLFVFGTSGVMEVAEAEVAGAACTKSMESTASRWLIIHKCILPWHTLFILVLI